MDKTARRTWLDTAAEILASPEPAHALEHLTTGLTDTFNVFMGARVIWRNATAQSPAVIADTSSFNRAPHWDAAVRTVAPHHPLTQFHMDLRHLEPSLLIDVTHRGKDMTQTARDLFDEYHLGRHHLSLPVVTRHYTTSYGLVRDEPFKERDVEDAKELQRLIVGLETHIRLVRELQDLRPANAAQVNLVKDEPHQSLTTREVLILEMIAQGKTATGIAARLAISPRTVHKHQENLYRKLGAQDRLSAVLRAQSMGILKSSDPQRPNSKS